MLELLPLLTFEGHVVYLDLEVVVVSLSMQVLLGRLVATSGLSPMGELGLAKVVF